MITSAKLPRSRFCSALKQGALRFGKGALIGSSMLIPGVSGGSAAVLLRIYDELVEAVASLLHTPRKSCSVLIPVALGGLIGMLLLARPLLALLTRFPAPVAVLLSGILLGSIPFLTRHIGRKTLLSSFLSAVGGLAVALTLSALPEGLFSVSVSSFSGCCRLFLLGFPLALALVLPGISVSYMMTLFSLYLPFLQAIQTFSIPFLLPLAGGIALGTLLLTGVLSRLSNRFPAQSDAMIAGFLLGSLPALWRGIALPSLWPMGFGCLVFCGAGLLMMKYLFSFK